MKDYYPKLSITEYVKRYGSPNETINKSYSHKPHLANLPHDRRTNDPDKLQERIDAIDERLAEHYEKAYQVEKEYQSLQQHQKELNTEKLNSEKKTDKINQDILNRESHIKDCTVEYDTVISDAISNWEEYKTRLDKGYEDYTGPISKPWSSEKTEKVRKEAEQLDKKVQKFKDKKYEEMTSNDFKELDDLNQDIGSFIKGYYDHQTDSMETIWFEYGSPFDYNLDLHNEITLRNEEIKQLTHDKNNFEAHIHTLTNEMDKNDVKIKDYEKQLSKLKKEGIDYVEERKKCEAKMKDIKKD